MLPLSSSELARGLLGQGSAQPDAASKLASARAAACCRFPPASLLAASSAKVRRSPTPPASWPQRERQQAAAFLPRAWSQPPRPRFGAARHGQQAGLSESGSKLPHSKASPFAWTIARRLRLQAELLLRLPFGSPLSLGEFRRPRDSYRSVESRGQAPRLLADGAYVAALFVAMHAHARFDSQLWTLAVRLSVPWRPAPGLRRMTFCLLHFLLDTPANLC